MIFRAGLMGLERLLLATSLYYWLYDALSRTSSAMLIFLKHFWIQVLAASGVKVGSRARGLLGGTSLRGLIPYHYPSARL